MALSDLVFSLGLKSDKFDANMKKAGAELRRLGQSRLDGLRKEMASLKGSTDNLAKTRLRGLMTEYSTLQGVMRKTADVARQTAAKSAPKSAGGGPGLMGGFGLGAAAGVGMAAVQAVVRAVQSMSGSIIGANANTEETVQLFTSLSGSADKAKDIVGALRKEADVTPFDTAAVVEAGKSLFTAAGNDQKRMMEMVKLAERLAVLNPEQGLKGAAFALKEALSGDYVSLKERFNIGKSEIDALKQQGVVGDKLVGQILTSKNITQQTVDAMGKTFTGRLSTLRSFISNIIRELGTGIFQRLSDLMGQAGDWIAANGDSMMTRAREIGATIGEWVGAGVEFARGLMTTFQGIGVYVQGIREFISMLGDKLAETWGSGKMMQTLVAMIGGVLVAAARMAWAALQGLGAMMVSAIVDGIPALVALIAKMLTDAVAGALGPRLSKRLGLNLANKEYNAVINRGASNMSGVAGSVGRDIFAAGRAAMGDLGSVAQIGRQFVADDLGGSQAMATARSTQQRVTVQQRAPMRVQILPVQQSHAVAYTQ